MLLQDLRFAYRVLWKSPGFTAVVVLTLALGIGANTAIFSVVNAVLLKSLPYRNAERLVWVAGNVRGGTNRASVSPPDYLDYRAQNTVFEEFAASTSVPYPVNLTGAGEPERLTGSLVTANYFRAFGVEPALGRVFGADEERAGPAPVAVLSDGLWKRRFGGDPSVVGKTLTLDGKGVTVVGVAPPEFQYPAGAELWVPLDFSDPEMKVRKAHFLRPIGLLKEGVTLEQARAETDLIARRLEEQYPDSNERWNLNLIPLQEQLVGSVRTSLWVLLGAVGFVLLIACANVSNLMLARAASRRRELALRTALGASRWRVARQQLTESLLLAVAGGAAGLLLAAWGVDALAALGAGDIPRTREIGVDGRVLLFTAALSVLTGLAFGLLPALRASRPDLNEVLKDAGRGTSGPGRGRVRAALVVSEIALALTLLTGAGLLVKSFVGLRHVNPGFDPSNILTVRIDLARARYAKPEQAASFFGELQRRVAALPGVEAAGLVTELPLSGQPNDTYFYVADRPPQTADQKVTADFRRVNQDYFRAMRIPVLRGRGFTEQETAGDAKVIAINETLAREFFPGEDPLGKHLVLGFGEPEEFEIVGVVGDVRHRSLEGDVYQMMYVPTLRVGSTNLVVRTNSADPRALASAVRGEVAAVDREQPVSALRTMEEVVSGSVAQQRFRTLLLAVFAGVALLLAGVGIYGVIAYSVTHRTHEIGIRMALGAGAADILKMVIGQGMALALAGIAVGLLAAYGLTRVLSSLLFGVTATDKTTFAAVALLIAIVTFLACLLPARRATKVDPMVALKYE
ncbi:MAG: ABC transporter permease [Acidobacteria bacterium]|nr:ABC transporter permease [Acidobacteriota bacterium]